MEGRRGDGREEKRKDYGRGGGREKVKGIGRKNWREEGKTKSGGSKGRNVEEGKRV